MKDKRIQSAVAALGYLALHEGKERVRLPRAFAAALAMARVTFFGCNGTVEVSRSEAVQRLVALINETGDHSAPLERWEYRVQRSGIPVWTMQYPMAFDHHPYVEVVLPLQPFDRGPVWVEQYTGAFVETPEENSVRYGAQWFVPAAPLDAIYRRCVIQAHWQGKNEAYARELYLQHLTRLVALQREYRHTWVFYEMTVMIRDDAITYAREDVLVPSFWSWSEIEHMIASVVRDYCHILPQQVEGRELFDPLALQRILADLAERTSALLDDEETEAALLPPDIKAPHDIHLAGDQGQWPTDDDRFMPGEAEMN
jgi:hypothetical protein